MSITHVYHVSERHCFARYSAIYIKWVQSSSWQLMTRTQMTCTGDSSGFRVSPWYSVCSKTSQNRETPNLWTDRGQKQQTEDRGFKTSNWFGGFTRGKRKTIWKGNSWGLVTGHGKTNHLSVKWAILHPFKNLWWLEWINTHTYLKLLTG